MEAMKSCLCMSIRMDFSLFMVLRDHEEGG